MRIQEDRFFGAVHKNKLKSSKSHLTSKSHLKLTFAANMEARTNSRRGPFALVPHVRIYVSHHRRLGGRLSLESRPNRRRSPARTRANALNACKRRQTVSQFF